MSHVVQINQPGGPEVLDWVEVDDPIPAGGQVVVDVYAAGVNFIDTYHRSGLYPMPLPFVPGSEGAGTVESMAPDVDGIAVGDRVAWVGAPGSYATKVVVDASTLLAVPAEIPLETAAAMPLQAMTAHYLVTDTFALAPGHRCLIHAAAGGTGRLMVQMAKLRGAEVVATVGSEAKAALARSAGADHVVNYATHDLAETVEDLVGAEAIDVVFDGVGAATFEAGLRLLCRRGMMVTFGNASGPVPPVAPLDLMPKSLFLTRPNLFNYIFTTEERDGRWDEIVGWVRNGVVEVRVGHEFTLAEASAAHAALESRATTGKILLKP